MKTGKGVDNMKFRHEWKHEIGYSDMLILRSRLKSVMQSDPNAKDGRYFVRSLYFDNLQDKALMEKINGVNRREKFRLRYYNNDLSHITLEKKSKINGLCGKQQQVIGYEIAEQILNGDIEALTASDRPSLLMELGIKMKTQGLMPKTIVDYEREPFICEAGNTRVTMDYNIRTGLISRDFLEPESITVPAGDAPIILEVKWDEFLPSFVRDLVQIPGRRTSAFSKYAACRIYG